MTIVRWEPLREFSPLQNEMNRLFNTVFDAPAPGNGGHAAPLDAADGPRRDRGPLRPAPIPGLSEDDVNIEFEDGTLTVSGERKAEHETKNEGYYRVERAFGSFSRSLTLPKGINAEAVTADFDRGVLEIRIPKPEERKPRRIEIGGAKSHRGRRPRRPPRSRGGALRAGAADSVRGLVSIEIHSRDPGSHARTGTPAGARRGRTPAFVPLATKAVVKTPRCARPPSWATTWCSGTRSTCS